MMWWMFVAGWSFRAAMQLDRTDPNDKPLRAVCAMVGLFGLWMALR
jgi:hypothetical protein